MDELSEHETRSKIESLVDRARDAGIDVTVEEIWDVLEGRVADSEKPATYSWVHLNKFRTFELHNRCFPWTTEEELRAAVDELPSPMPRPEWEDCDEP